MTKKKKRVIICAAALAAGVSFCAGAYICMNRYDAGDYVQAVLDVSYKGIPDAYMEITDISEKEAEEIFEDNLDAAMKEFESEELPENLQPRYRELFGELARNVSYTVEEPHKEKDGNYTVNVQVKPICLFADTYDTFEEKAREYAEEVTDSVMKGGKMPTDEEMQGHVYEIYYDVLREAMDKGSLYGEVRDVTIHVQKTGMRSFKADEDDMDLLDSLLIEVSQTDN